MAALVESDVTVTIPANDRNFNPGIKTHTMASITFGNGSSTYPVGGVPLPDKSQFGFNRVIEMGLIQEPPANGYSYKYDSDNNKIRIFNGGTELTAGAAPAEATMKMLMIGQ